MTIHGPVALRSAPASMIERMTLILDTFDGSAPVRTLVDVAERTGLPRSSVHRIVDQMIRLRWLAHAPGGYRLGTRALELGGLAIAHTDVRDALGPLLHELCRGTGMVAHLGVLDGPEVLVVDKAVARGADPLPTRLGGRIPAHCTAVGKALLATLPPTVIDLAFGPRLPRRTPRTLPHRTALHDELAAVRRHHGVAVDRAEALPGIVCVAVTLRPPTGGTVALSLSGRVGEHHRPDPSRLARLLIEARQELGPGGRD